MFEITSKVILRCFVKQNRNLNRYIRPAYMRGTSADFNLLKFCVAWTESERLMFSCEFCLKRKEERARNLRHSGITTHGKLIQTRCK